MRGNYHKLLSATKAMNQRWRSATLFRAKMSGLFPTLNIINLAASSTCFIKSVFMPTLQTANGISVGDRFIDNKRFRADWANLANFVHSGFVVTNSGTKELVCPAGMNVKRSVANRTGLGNSGFCRGVVALGRTIYRFKQTFLGFARRACQKFLATSFTVMLHVKRYYTKLVGRCQSLFVYNLEVSESHTYYANGVLVHNCQWCAPMDGKIVGLSDDYFRMGDRFTGDEGGVLKMDYNEINHPPLHPQCRCSIIPVLKEI